MNNGIVDNPDCKNSSSLFTEVILENYDDVTEHDIKQDIAKYLKYAPKRVGGGGRIK